MADFATKWDAKKGGGGGLFLQLFGFGKAYKELWAWVTISRDLSCQRLDIILDPSCNNPSTATHGKEVLAPRLQMALKAFCPVSHPAVQSGLPLCKILTPSLQAHSLECKPYLSAPTYFSLVYSPGVLFSQFPLPVTLKSCCSWFLAQLFLCS